MTTLTDTQPITPVDPTPPMRRFAAGDRLTDMIGPPGSRRRYVGSVIESTSLVFRIQWSGRHGIATYSHGLEPATLRHATPRDEHEVAVVDQVTAVAAELHRLAETERSWPAEIRMALRARARSVLGGA